MWRHYTDENSFRIRTGTGTEVEKGLRKAVFAVGNLVLQSPSEAVFAVGNKWRRKTQLRAHFGQAAHLLHTGGRHGLPGCGSQVGRIGEASGIWCPDRLRSAVAPFGRYECQIPSSTLFCLSTFLVCFEFFRFQSSLSSAPAHMSAGTFAHCV